MGRSKAAPERVRSAATRQKALELRAAGSTYRNIGAVLGISLQAAHQHVLLALEQIRTATAETADAMRTIELERLDAMLAGLWPSATSGDVAAVNAALRVSERRSKLLGLDAPTRLAGHDGGALRTFVELAREVMSDAGRAPAGV